MQTELIYGIHVVLQFLQHHPEDILEILITETRRDEKIKTIMLAAKEQGIALISLSTKQMDKQLNNATHQGVAARVRVKEYLTEQDLVTLIEHSKTPPLFLVLDGIQDPHNLGACLRTADAVNLTAVIIPKDRQTSVTAVVRKVASGAAETVNIVQVTNLSRCLEQLKKLGVWIIGTAGEATKSLYEVDFRMPIALVLGAEGTGLRRLTKEHCDILMRIPMLGNIESLNVSVAAAVCLYEALRQRLGVKS